MTRTGPSRKNCGARKTPTHFGRILQDLGIGYIAAGSPQAKGRIERLWRTLQDRLVSELRLRGITTLEAANAFLPAFLADLNPRFARAPADATPAWRPAPRDLGRVAQLPLPRTVARDNTVRLGPRWVQLRPARAAAPTPAVASRCGERLMGGCGSTARAASAWRCSSGQALSLSSAPWRAPFNPAGNRQVPLRARPRRGAALSPSPSWWDFFHAPRGQLAAPRRRGRPAPTHPGRQPYNHHLLDAKGLAVHARTRGSHFMEQLA